MIEFKDLEEWAFKEVDYFRREGKTTDWIRERIPPINLTYPQWASVARTWSPLYPAPKGYDEAGVMLGLNGEPILIGGCFRIRIIRPDRYGIYTPTFPETEETS